MDLIFWGKSQLYQGKSVYLTVWEHCLNVTAVARVWLEQRENLLGQWARLLGLGTDASARRTAQTIALHFILLHDLGKYDFRFQGKLPDLFERLNQTAIPIQKQRFDHGRWGLNYFAAVFSGKKNRPWIQLMRAAASHHGTWAEREKYLYQDKIQLLPGNGGPPTDGDRARDQAIFSHMQKAQALFPLPDAAIKPIRTDAMVFLAGLCSVADWLGSNSDYFPCKPLDQRAEPEEITPALEKNAARVLADNHLLGRYCGEEDTRLSRIFPGVSPLVPRPLQQAALDMELGPDPQLLVIEAPMGEGKTEAALILADRLLGAGHAHKLYFALPTMATSNAMYSRMAEVLGQNRFFDSHSSLVLAHGKRNLKPEFQRTVRLGKNRERVTDEQNPPAGMVCNHFFAQSHKRSLLAQAGVGTVDQILSAVLIKRHHWVKLFALAHAVVIIDEVHAYDAYMREILSRLIQWLRALGTHVILLSATLPRTIRQELSSAFGSQWTETKGKDYPLITRMDGTGEPCFIPCQSRSQKALTMRLSFDFKAICSHVLAQAAQGAQCCVILNTVAKAQELYAQLCLAPKNGDIELLLFHSRFMLCHRGEKEAAVLARFGKAGKRSPGRILIATQVAEQSLDVDFDVMVSEIAPIDLLLQRAGRLHRFEANHGARHGTAWQSPVLTVYNPCETASDLLLDRRTHPPARSVYDAAILYRTALLFAAGDIRVQIPCDIRFLVDQVYEGRALDIPESDQARYTDLWEQWENFEYISQIGGANAIQPKPDQSPKKLKKAGFDSAEDPECAEMVAGMKTGGTRLAEKTVKVVFVHEKWLENRQAFHDSPKLYKKFIQTLEEHSLSLIQKMLPGVDSNTFQPDPDRFSPEEWRNIRSQFQKELPRWIDHLILPLPVTEPEIYRFTSSHLRLSYSPDTGLRIIKDSDDPLESKHLGLISENLPYRQDHVLIEKSPEQDTDPSVPLAPADPAPKSGRPPAPAQDLIAMVRSNPLRDRISYLHVGHARLDVDDSGLVMTTAESEVFQQIPVASLSLILLEPGSVITHEAIKLCATHKCLLIWTGEGGVRLYSAGYSDFARSDKLLHQARMYHEPKQRLAVVRRMFEIRFKQPCPKNKSIEQLRGMEGRRVRKRYGELSEKYKVEWDGRFYDPNKWDTANTINRVISVGTSCLYGIVEAAILTAGYSPAIGFLHTGKARSFVYDIGDLYKDELVLPLCFQLVRDHEPVAETLVRHQLREVFRKGRLLEVLIPGIEQILSPVE